MTKHLKHILGIALLAMFSASTYGSKPVVNATPQISNDKLIETIVAKYKGKVVVVDFWATWCNPCLNAMKTMAPLKEELKEKNVVFVYITNSSSPKDLWSKTIETIGSEHYYLEDKEQWNYLMSSFEIKGIPSYVIYDTNGVQKHKVTGYPGNEKMKGMITESISK